LTANVHHNQHPQAIRDRRLFSANAIIGFCLVLMRGDRIVDLAIIGIKYNHDKRIIIMAIATPKALTDNRIRYVTNIEGKTVVFCKTSSCLRLQLFALY
jgi:hypothetical protein